MGPGPLGLLPRINSTSLFSGWARCLSKRCPSTYAPTLPCLGVLSKSSIAQQSLPRWEDESTEEWTGKVTQSGRGTLRASLPRSAGRPSERCERGFGGGGLPGPACALTTLPGARRREAWAPVPLAVWRPCVGWARS